MKVHFLGTAAAEGVPNPFCHCEVCEKTRHLGGRNIRSRTSVLIDETLKVDYPPDSFYHALRDRIDLSKVEDLLITHTHCDHYNPADLEMRIEGFAHGIDKPLHIYGNDLAIQGCRLALPTLQEGKRFAYHRVLPFKEVQTQTAKITPLLADHDPMETCLLYYIEKDGKTILYGNDTGWFPDETWEWLKTKPLDLAILDCTGGYNSNKRSRNHMCIETVLEVQSAFERTGILKARGQIIATHFTHNAELVHDDFVEAFKPYDIQVAYDGMTVYL
ncbi:phosphoribosyl 1,2-cyclic phosphate phosphodiesterase [Pullulanibacillus pueri]|uniref:ATP-binding protein n=1 Tax=Pullulanibacillus pueri TaxID=1437324 RepID=A0A8J2ZRL9_9BACL|nr:MBL fold metallo-hydrolase [Pullulanibacillus pueri]MBM7679931.1 phosphoribosyl 1,2-cyclic phosphate phosphodiesterase [Pullulanibacillus pueri]GGH73547.1 ATP-binding protein [Pullulanibacillus pueri]